MKTIEVETNGAIALTLEVAGGVGAAALGAATADAPDEGKLAARCQFGETPVAKLSKLEAKIRAGHLAYLKRIGSALELALEVGKHIETLKLKAGHGGFEKTLLELEGKIGLSPRSARDYRRIAQGWPRLQSQLTDDQLASLSLREALRLLSPASSKKTSDTKTGKSAKLPIACGPASDGSMESPPNPISKITSAKIVDAERFTVVSATVAEPEDDAPSAETQIALRRPPNLIEQESRGSTAELELCTPASDPVAIDDLAQQVDGNSPSVKLATEYTALPGADGCNTSGGKLSASGIVATVLLKNPRLLSIANQLRALNARFATMLVDPYFILPRQTNARFDESDLAFLPISATAYEAAHLYFLATHDKIGAGCSLIAAWGFEVKTSLAVVGRRVGVNGPCWDAGHYIMLVASRGQSAFRRSSFSTWLDAKGVQDTWQIRHRIRECSEGPYLQVFGEQVVEEEDWTILS